MMKASVLLCLLFTLMVAATVQGVPDGTSTVTCEHIEVQAGQKMAGDCVLEVKNGGKSTEATFADFKLAVSGGGSVSDPNPASGLASRFTFVMQSGTTTGPEAITSVYDTAPFKFTVYSIPDSTSIFTCNENVFKVDEAISCQIIPRLKSKQIYVKSDQYALSPAEFTWNPVTPPIGNMFNITGKVSANSGLFTVSDGFADISVTVVDDPDETSELVCGGASDNTEVQAGSYIDCAITPMKQKQRIYTYGTHFKLSGGNKGATFSAIPTGISNYFTFTYTTGPSDTGMFPVSDGFNEVKTIVWDIPSASSSLSCSDPENKVAIGAPVECTTKAKNGAGDPITSLASQLSLSCPNGDSPPVQDGNFTVPSPHFGTEFKFNFIGGSKIGTVFVNDGFSPAFSMTVVEPTTPDATSTIECKQTTIEAEAPVMCWVNAMVSTSSVYSKASEFTFSDNGAGGKFSTLSPSVGRIVYATYTAGDKGGVVDLDVITPSGTSKSIAITITGGSSSSSSVSTTEIIIIVVGSLAAVALLGAIFMWCKKAGSSDEEALLAPMDEESYGGAQ